jgi:hypothetical protein
MNSIIEYGKKEIFSEPTPTKLFHVQINPLMNSQLRNFTYQLTNMVKKAIA